MRSSVCRRRKMLDVIRASMDRTGLLSIGRRQNTHTCVKPRGRPGQPTPENEEEIGSHAVHRVAPIQVVRVLVGVHHVVAHAARLEVPKGVHAVNHSGPPGLVVEAADVVLRGQREEVLLLGGHEPILHALQVPGRAGWKPLPGILAHDAPLYKGRVDEAPQPQGLRVRRVIAHGGVAAVEPVEDGGGGDDKGWVAQRRQLIRVAMLPIRRHIDLVRLHVADVARREEGRVREGVAPGLPLADKEVGQARQGLPRGVVALCVEGGTNGKRAIEKPLSIQNIRGPGS